MNPGFIKLLPMLGKTLDQLTDVDFKLIATTLGLKVDLTPELKDAALAMLHGQDINTVADLIQKPESVKQLMAFVSPPATSAEIPMMVARCPHCKEFSLQRIPQFTD